MGALKLTYYETKNPLKVVYSKTLEEQKSVQRFLSVDPMSELDFHLSPYNYVGNNPLNFVDPTGMKRVNIEGSRNYYDDETWELTVVGDKPHSDPVFGNMYVITPKTTSEQATPALMISIFKREGAMQP